MSKNIKDWRLDIAWAAGLFDGEGCVSIGYMVPKPYNNIRNVSHRLCVKVTMGCELTVKRFGQIAGAGNLHNHVAATEKTSASFSWVAMAAQAYHVLKRLRPFLITKAKEADVGIEFFELPDGRTGGNGGSKLLDPDLLQRRHELFIKCCKLKSRWRWRKNKPSSKPPEPVTRRSNQAK